ncbi:cobyric acid synthase [Brucella intermedia]|uniref:cobyric acid synthase n=1 Tax=Brucella TaxID=234 RepID=UPI0004693358|nr:cobyric acid synthase [Brucella intermedia]PJT27245.1 cobyric acid synthase [Ochrobactrum sp. 30A/1000/2015]PJT38667.1 cobyric acid synthase [Ochrobactrum sp. 27A/999/2015]PJT44683.1 cobyric acid synthase [Ochrobactrum sp. 23A/997/2015]KAB2714709.1 cobyric acid synthase [Brucella intermedia]OAB83543.1 cobyric acid synthase CobQ [Brucella intermedia]
MARAIMFQGTGSDVGKSVLVAGLCRVARNRGLKVRPFKPQNMSNNAAVSDDGGEIGRAQWLQALACGVPSSVHMNPVLLKPQTDMGSQVVVQGQVRGEARGRYYQELKPQLMAAVMESFAHVSEGADLVLVEGAGSPAEINLRAGDIANMGFATQADVPVVLVGDIDRGGVIASLVGTHTILSEQDRAMVRGFLINKFRGDISLFDDGLAAITRFTGWHSFGVVPWLKAVSRLPAEDSVVLERAVAGYKRALVVAVPVLPRIANFDDLDPLKAEPDVEVVMVPPGSSIPGEAGLVILPGTKSTIADLMALRDNGWDRQLSAHVRRGGHVLGICGGFQMLGRHISDPAGIEGRVRDIEGLGFLDIETLMAPEKVVRNVQATSCLHNVPLEGYEIHIGRTTGPDMARPFARLAEHHDGAISPDGRIMGTYLHGVFNADEFRRKFLESLGVRSSSVNYRVGVEDALNELAEGLEGCLNIEALFNLK